MFICCECCVFSGSGLCDELITRPEESYRLWCVVVCDLETWWMRRPWPTGGCHAANRKYLFVYIRMYVTYCDRFTAYISGKSFDSIRCYIFTGYKHFDLTEKILWGHIKSYLLLRSTAVCIFWSTVQSNNGQVCKNWRYLLIQNSTKIICSNFSTFFIITLFISPPHLPTILFNPAWREPHEDDHQPFINATRKSKTTLIISGQISIFSTDSSTLAFPKLPTTPVSRSLISQNLRDNYTPVLEYHGDRGGNG